VNSFLENKFVAPIQKLGKLLHTNESVECMHYIWQERKYSIRYDKFSGPRYATQGGPHFGANGKTYPKMYLFGYFVCSG
jgi:hypothetical protein